MAGSLAKQKNGFLFVFAGAVLLTVSVLVFAFSAQMAFNYALVRILPLFYTFCVFLIFILNPNVRKNKPAMLILFLYAVRMVVFPLFLNMNGGYPGDRIESDVFLYIDPAVLAQCYEFLAAAVVISFARENVRPENGKGTFVLEDSGKTKSILCVIIALTVIFGLAVFYYPSLLRIFHPAVMDSGDYVKWQISNEQIKRHVPLILYHLSAWAIPLLKIIWVYYFIMIIKKTVKKETPAFWLSILLISTLILITTDDKAGGAFAALAMIPLLFKLYPGKRKAGLGLVAAMIVTAFLLTFILLPFKSRGGDFAGYIGYKINAYFSGTVNIAASLTMPRSNLAAYFAGDVLRSIPLAQGFFTDMPMSYLLFNQSLGFDTVYNSQILPCVGQSCFYFGYGGAPVFSVVLILLAMKCYHKTRTAEDSFGFFIYYYLAIFLSAGVVLYDFFLTLYLIMQYCLPFLVIYKLLLVKRPEPRAGNVQGAPCISAAAVRRRAG